MFGASLALFSGGLVGVYQLVFASGDHEGAEPTGTTSASTLSGLIETVEANGLKDLGSSTSSWPGEILSTSDVGVHSVREGQIAEWRVKLGQVVRKGQVLGRLTPPSATIELNSAIASRTEALVRARAQEEATQILVHESRVQLTAVRLALDKSRDTALLVADTEANQAFRFKEGAAQELTATQSNKDASVQAAQAELVQAESSVPLKRQALRVAIERLAQRTAGRLSYSGMSPTTSTGALNMTFKQEVGTPNSTAQNNYRETLARLIEAMKDPQALPDSFALAFVKASQDLLASTSGGSVDLPQSELNEIRTELMDDQKDLIEALGEYKEAQTAIAMKQAELVKITSERERELAAARTASLTTELASLGSFALKNKLIAEADSDYAKQKSELERTISQLNRELRMAHAEVKAAEAGYAIMAAGVAGQDIIAPQNGVVSAIFKVLGEHVSPEIVIAGISSADAKGRFIRFKIPGDMRIPEAGEDVFVERPGFANTNVKAKIVGVGLALDVAGSYTADAEFIEPTNWPVHASVRVTAKDTDTSIFVPMGAVWFDDRGATHVWLVTENNKIRPQVVKIGRSFGDKIEVEEGLNLGDRYIAKAQTGMETGQSAETTKPVTEKTAQPKEEGGDGHAHSHD